MKSSITELPTRSVQGSFVCPSPLASVGLQGEMSACAQDGQTEQWLRLEVCVVT